MKSEPRMRVTIWACAVLSLTFVPALAQPLSGPEAIKARQAHFKDMGRAFKAAGDQLKSTSPDFGVIKSSAVDVGNYSKQLPGWFPKGTGKEAGIKTRALPEIWTDPSGFAAAAHGSQLEAAKFAALTQSSTDVEALRAEQKAVGQACGACHTKYREPE